MEPPSSTRSVVGRNVVMRRYILLKQAYVGQFPAIFITYNISDLEKITLIYCTKYTFYLITLVTVKNQDGI
jgi:hypothetical protein